MNFHLNLEVILVSLTLISGLILLYYFFRGKRDIDDKEPLLLDYSKSFFPILLIVIVLRSFVAEPFRIPSGSMIPTLEIGDFVLVKKYAYGIKLPIIHHKIIDIDKPSRGDVVVFRYPPNPKINYIKRLIGLPGDVIEWTKDKKVIINGESVTYKSLGKYQTANRSGQLIDVDKLEEILPDTDRSHELINFPGLSREGKWTVPEDHYFMMGDNRDNSSDSRFWKFVPEKNLVGKASLIWMHWDWSDGGDGFKPSRIGTTIK
ncbi:MAG: signal peptidase I [Cocleimonas sp.]|jgi:signal peptidase I